MRNVHLTKGQAYSHQRGCYIRTMTTRAQLKRKISARESQGWRQDELIDGKPPVVK
jgi:hypothetical protein